MQHRCLNCWLSLTKVDESRASIARGMCLRRENINAKHPPRLYWQRDANKRCNSTTTHQQWLTSTGCSIQTQQHRKRSITRGMLLLLPPSKHTRLCPNAKCPEQTPRSNAFCRVLDSYQKRGSLAKQRNGTHTQRRHDVLVTPQQKGKVSNGEAVIADIDPKGC